MKAVMLSIQPKWCELIASGRKTIEVRKTRPQLKMPFKCYIYCTKDAKRHYYIDEYGDRKLELIPTKVIGEFVCDRLFTIRDENYGESGFIAGGVSEEQWSTFAVELLKNACLTVSDAKSYLQREHGLCWHISALKIYDTPKELSEFLYPCKQGFSKVSEECKGCRYAFKGTTSGEIYCDRTVLRPFQSWGYVEESNE